MEVMPKVQTQYFAESGGKGAKGTNIYGGGGGSGGHYNALATHPSHNQVEPGINASGYSGGPAKINPKVLSGAGGDGGNRGVYNNGGLLCIHCDSTFNGLGGIIDVSGLPGADGKPGLNRTLPPIPY